VLALRLEPAPRSVAGRLAPSPANSDRGCPACVRVLTVACVDAETLATSAQRHRDVPPPQDQDWTSAVRARPRGQILASMFGWLLSALSSAVQLAAEVCSCTPRRHVHLPHTNNSSLNSTLD
jgi:hypothetical protein